MNNNMIPYALLGFSILASAHLNSMQSISNSTIASELREKTPIAMVHYCAMKKIFELFLPVTHVGSGPIENGAWDQKFCGDFNYPTFGTIYLNPHYYKTKVGLALTYVGDRGTRLHTPWGGLDLDIPYTLLKSRLEAHFSLQEFPDSSGEGCGHCAILGEYLPFPVAAEVAGNAKSSPWLFYPFSMFTVFKQGDYDVVSNVLPVLEAEYQRMTHE